MAAVALRIGLHAAYKGNSTSTQLKCRRHSSAARAKRRCSIPGESCWSVEDSASLYNLQAWGAPYFDTTDARDGRVVVKPFGSKENQADAELDLFDIAMAVREQLGSGGPVVLRFPEIARCQAEKLYAAFDEAARIWDYGSAYQAVFPVKCCHDVATLMSLVSLPSVLGFGLEAGSKAELLLAIAVMRKAASMKVADGEHDSMSWKQASDEKGSRVCPLLVCNGYKDKDYIRLAVSSASMGIRTVIVLEKLSELPAVVQCVKAVPLSADRPFLGIRIRLATTHDGQWGATSGDDSKFGLGARETLLAVQTLLEEDMIDCLRLLHFHIGSQVSRIATIKEAMRESSQMYAELVRLGAPMGYIDVGGGLGVDYSGSQGGGGHMSTNYNMQNYANDIVAALKDTCIRTGIEPPVIVSESGRAIVSSSAALVFEVIDTEPRGARGSSSAVVGTDADQTFLETEHIERGSEAMPSIEELRMMAPGAFLLHNFREVLKHLSCGSATSAQESLNDATQFRQEADRLFKLGIMGLEDRAETEALYASVRETAFLFALRDSEGRSPLIDVQSASMQPAVWYHANMSVFRSLPDSWAIGQLFPVVPLHRLTEYPEVNCSIADLTCDSDGRIDRFVGPISTDGQSVSPRGQPAMYIPLHHHRKGENYLVAAFLVGAYQDSMGSRGHNLFGSPSAATVFMNGSGVCTSMMVQDKTSTFKLKGATVTVRAGQTAAEVLDDIGVHGDELVRWVENSSSNDEHLVHDTLETYQNILRSTTYFESF